MECPSQQHQGAIAFELTGAPEGLNIWWFQSLKKSKSKFILSLINDLSVKEGDYVKTWLGKSPPPCPHAFRRP